MGTQSKAYNIKALTEKLEEGIQNVMDGERFCDYLKFSSQFTSYSYRNVLLIYLQHPDAEFPCAGYKSWEKMGRHVKKGQQGIKIFAPSPYKRTVMRDVKDPVTGKAIHDPDGSIRKERVQITVPSFRVTYVFSSDQTEGRPLPTLYDDLVGDVNRFADFMDAVSLISPVPIHLEEMEGKDGYYHQLEKRIAIRSGMSQKQTMAAVFHELAHALLHDLDPNDLEASAKDLGKSLSQKEVEAESVSFVCCARYGIETDDNSLGYIAGYCKDRSLPELHASLKLISETSTKIIQGIDDYFARFVKLPELDYALDSMEIDDSELSR